MYKPKFIVFLSSLILFIETSIVSLNVSPQQQQKAKGKLATIIATFQNFNIELELLLTVSAFDVDTFYENFEMPLDEIFDKASQDLYLQMSGLANLLGVEECQVAEHDRFTGGWTNGMYFLFFWKALKQMMPKLIL